MKTLIKKLLGAPAPAPEPRNKALWSIGIYTGTSPLALGPDASISSPIITREHVTDIPAALVADPFLVHDDGIWYLFFEALNRRTRRGEIALATSRDLTSWLYKRVVLTEPFHVSYPHIFEWMGAMYMVPETHETRTIRLYKADPFPYQWTLVHTIASGRPFADSTFFRHDDRWWVFTETSTAQTHDTLRLYYADDLVGVWTEHPSSPIVGGDPHTARPAGRVVRDGERFIRFAQVCAPRYGMSVSAFEITDLTTTTYAERPVSPNPILRGTSEGWNATRMHHIDAHEIEPGRWIAAVDGAEDATMTQIFGAT